MSVRNPLPLRLSALALFSAALPVALPAAAHATPRYSVTIVGVAGSSGTGINASGVVVGNYPFSATATRGFVNVAGVITDLGTLGGDTFAEDINDAGVIVGKSVNGDGNDRAFRHAAGAMADLGTLGGNISGATSINNRGDIAGWAAVPAGSPLAVRAFLLRPGVSMQDLGAFEVPDPEGSSFANGLNEARQVVGGSPVGPYSPPETPFHAFLYACEEMRDLGTLGGQYSLAYAINDRGQVVGITSTPEFREDSAFLYYRGVMRNIGGLPGWRYSTARDINNRGQVVGDAYGVDAGVGWHRGFLYHDGKMRFLNNLVPAASGWGITSADAINAGGQIAGTGCKAGLCYAVRLDPAP